MIRAVGSIMARRFTGLLRVTRDKKLVSLSFRDGQPVFVEELTAGMFRTEDSLARPLVRQGILTPVQYASVVKQMKGVSSANVDVWFCDIALRLGYLTHNQIFDAFTGRIREKFIETVGWRQCELSLDDSPAALRGYEQYPVKPGPVLYEAIRLHYDQDRIRTCLEGRFEHFISLRHSLTSVAKRFELDGNEVRLLESCDGTTTVTRIVQHSTMQRQRAWQLVCLLVLSDFAKLSEFSEPAAARRSTATMTESEQFPTEKPGVTSRRALSPSRKPSSQRPSHRDRALSRPVMESLTRELRRRSSARSGSTSRPASSKPAAAKSSSTGTASSQPASSKPASSRPAPSRPAAVKHSSTRPASKIPASSKPASMEPDSAWPQRKSHIDVIMERVPGDNPDKLAASEALAAWESGRRCLRARDYSSAREQFRLACKLDPRRGVYRMYFLWASRQASKGLDIEERRPHELKKLAEAHTCIEGHIGIASYILGHLALSEGNERAAEKYFKEAFDNDPDIRDAERQYRLLVKRRRYR